MEDEAFGAYPDHGNNSDAKNQAEVKQLLRQFTILVGISLVLFVNGICVQCASTWGNFRDQPRHRVMLIAVNAAVCILVLGYIHRTEFQLAM
jgi:hypothetical protein